MGVAIDSIVSPGSIVSGGRVIRSILSPGVRVNSWATVERSVILDHTVIGRHAVVRNAIIDKNVVVPPGTTIGVDHHADGKQFTVSDKGIVAIGKGEEISS
jgi:glucose-1-phosphate adenylyltransferase